MPDLMYSLYDLNADSVLLIGEGGSGKTTVLNMLAEETEEKKSNYVKIINCKRLIGNILL